MNYPVFFYSIVIGGVLIHMLIEILNLKAIDEPVRVEVRNAYGEALTDEFLTKTRSYIRARTRLDLIETLIGTGALLGFYALGGFQFLYSLSRDFISSFDFLSSASLPLRNAAHGAIFLLFLGLLSSALALPFRIYSTFVIEERFGFNRTTWKTFVLDIIRGAVLALILGGPLLILVLWIFERSSAAWLWAFLLVTFFQLFFMFVYPAFIAPIFNKFEPLPNGELKTEIEDFARKEKFSLQGIFTMDGSKRSTKANAYFTGFGRFRRIVLFDNLMEQMNRPELVAVLAHEIGHFKRKHILQQLALALLTSFIFFFAFSRFLEAAETIQPLGIPTPLVAVAFVAFGFIYAPLEALFSLGRLYLSRKFEFEADEYSIRTYHEPRALAEALKKLGIKNLSNPQPHPVKVMFEYTHPPLDQRLTHIEKLAARH